MYILEQCVKNNVSRFIYASSAYAMSNKGSFYGISKLASEKIIEEYSKKFDLSFTILRYGSVYSERSYDNNYIYNLVKSAVLDNKIDHHGDGNEIREYIHAADASKLSVDVIESEDFKNLHVILTGTERMKRLELFNMINEILNDKVAINCADDGYQSHYKHHNPYQTHQDNIKPIHLFIYLSKGNNTTDVSESDDDASSTRLITHRGMSCHVLFLQSISLSAHPPRS